MLGEKDETKRSARWEALQKRLETQFSTLQVLSAMFVAIGTTFKMVSFPVDIDTKNNSRKDDAYRETSHMHYPFRNIYFSIWRITVLSFWRKNGVSS